MTIFSLEIADADVDRVLSAVASNYGWEAMVENPDYPNFDELEVQLDEGGNPVLNEAGHETYVIPVDEAGNPIPAQIDNPETQGDLTHRMVRSCLLGHVKSHETRLARQQALEGLEINVDISNPE